MKLPSLKLAALALAGMAAFAQSANAQTVTSATGDLILGVYQTDGVTADGSGKTYEVDLGALTSFSSNVSLDLASRVSIADLDATFGGSAGLASTQWFVAGTSGTNPDSILNTPDATTVFKSAVLITDTTVPGTYSHNGLGTPQATISGLYTGLNGANQTAHSAYASILSESAPSQLGSNYNFGIAASGTSVSVIEGFGSTGNLYLLDPASDSTSATKGKTYDLGTFQFVGGTDFQFNPQVAAAPEPSTYALMGLGALLLIITARRRMASNL